MQKQPISEIHIAGYPKQIMSQEPPFWRYRLGQDHKELPLSTWHIQGTAGLGNNGHGTKKGASFLLWWSLRGVITIKDKAAHIELAPAQALPPQSPQAVQRFDQESVRIYAAPARASAGLPPPHWTMLLSGNQEYPITSYTLVGTATGENISPGVDITAVDPTRRVWLSFKGDVEITADHSVTIFLR